MLKLLIENSSKKFHIEHGGHLFNHLSQGIIALDALGANEQRLQRYIDNISPTLKSPESYLYEKNEVAKDENEVFKLLGKHQSFYPILDYYEEKLKGCNGSVTKLINQCFPKISSGMIGGAFHGVIQIGYGLSVNVPQIVCEGLAYLHFSNIALAVNASTLPYCELSNLGRGTLDILDVLSDVENDRKLSSFLKTEQDSGVWKERYKAKFGQDAAILFTCRGDALMSYVHSVRFPDWYRFEELNCEQLQRIGDWLFQLAVTVYVLSERRNDFFLLHGVTGAWSFLQIISRLENKTEALECVQAFLCSLFAVYVIQKTPKLLRELAMDGGGSTQNSLSSWQDIVTDLLKNENADTHIYKLVHVCRDMANKTRDSDVERLYLQAANYAVNNPLAYG